MSLTKGGGLENWNGRSSSHHRPVPLLTTSNGAWTEVAALSVLWVATSTAALWSLVVFGVLLVLSGLWSLAMPGSVASEYVHIGLGVLLFISPWVLGYVDLNEAAWTSWVIGVLAVAVGAAAVPVATTTHRGIAGQH